MENVVFEPGGELWNHRNNPKMIEKKSAATTIVFGDLLPSEVKVLHVSAQQEFHYETNCRMLPTLSWIQQIRQRSKWPPDHQDIVNLTKHIGLAKFHELLISDWAGRLQIYLWKPGAYDSILIIFGECSARARTSLDNKELEADQNALLLDHVKMQQSNLGSCLAASFDVGAVRGSYISNQKELSNKLNGNRNVTHQGLTSNWNEVQSFSNERVMGSTSRLILCLLCLNFSEFRTSQSYLWRPESCADYMEDLKHAKTKNKREEDKRFKPPNLSQERHHDKRSPIPFAKASDRCKGRGGACDRLEKSWIKQKELYAQGISSLDDLN
ncbi:hypothetical protein F2Q69_00048912 [Brassica cretica]|uniref:Uncharacterized protein n=1 Tax=Brassica cretica TaxID=69181 RepID=A0A8S9PS13_BRACR|nr:hypothetical protein F2Q69_00048912 [Brassica cretica]